jgi:hypothetical protein
MTFNRATTVLQPFSSFGVSDPRAGTRLPAWPIAMNVLKSLGQSPVRRDCEPIQGTKSVMYITKRPVF